MEHSGVSGFGGVFSAEMQWINNALAWAFYFIRHHLMQSRALTEFAEVLASIGYGYQLVIWTWVRPMSYLLLETKDAASTLSNASTYWKEEYKLLTL